MLLFLIKCMSACGYFEEARGGCKAPCTGVRGSCELPDTGTEPRSSSRVVVLFKTGQFLITKQGRLSELFLKVVAQTYENGNRRFTASSEPVGSTYSRLISKQNEQKMSWRCSLVC